jgi:NAD(P)-dependent dehydrogenase (short-subunit alcohol dehydrogenase family)
MTSTSNTHESILILGATGGIGSAVARKAAARGAKLTLAAQDQSRLDALAAEIGGTTLSLDATRAEDVHQAVQQAIEANGALTGVVNCVGSILLKPAHLTSEEEYRQTLALNLDTSFFLVKSAARAMMKSGGSIVLSTSAVARTGLFNHEAIAAAKAGVVGLMQSAAATYAQRGVRVNCVAPGLVETPMSERLTSNEAARKASEAMHALGRLGQPDDVAEAIDWLLDESRSSWVTGQVIGVDGGLGTIRPR